MDRVNSLQRSGHRCPDKCRMRRASAKPTRTALEQHLCSLSSHHGEAERRVGVRTASEKAALGTARLSLAKSHLLVVSSTDVRRTESASAEPLRSTRRIVAAVESCASGSSPQQPPARGFRFARATTSSSSPANLRPPTAAAPIRDCGSERIVELGAVARVSVWRAPRAC